MSASHQVPCEHLRKSISSLLSRRITLSQESWESEVEAFRASFFGPNHDEIRFPTKIHLILSCDSLYPDIFWLNDGKSFAIHRDGYVKNIMCIFFRQHKLKSFQSNIYQYGFKTEMSLRHFPISEAQDYLVYRHPLFLQGRGDLSQEIQRVGAATSKERESANSPRGQSAQRSPRSVQAFLNHQFADVFCDTCPLPFAHEEKIIPHGESDNLRCLSVSSSSDIEAEFDNEFVM